MRLRPISYKQLAKNDKDSVFDLWERGEIRPGFSTPSVWSSEYRAVILAILDRFVDAKGLCLSLGCGNGFVEAELASRSIKVLGLDAEPRAAILASRRVTAAVVGDAEALPFGPSRFAAAYADGLLGHLWDDYAGYQPFLKELRRVLQVGGIALISNDISKGERPCLRVSADHQAQFFRGPRGYLSSQVDRLGGLTLMSEQIWHYERPGRGARDREIVVISKAPGHH